MIQIWTDGGYKHNSCMMSIGILIKKDNNIFIEYGRKLGYGTSNRAEYLAFIAALKIAKYYGFDEIECFSDSKLMVMQVNGKWQIRSEHLRMLAKQARDLASTFSKFSLVHIPRIQNQEADKLTHA